MATRAFLFTEIEGSPALMRRLGKDAYAQVLAAHHALVRSFLAEYDGSEMDSREDAVLAVFSSPPGCVAAVLDLQQAVAARDWPGGEQVRVRMGVHCGPATAGPASPDGFSGVDGVDGQLAGRVAAVGYGGQVLVTEPAASIVRDSLPPGAALTDLGVHRLRDLGRPEQIFQLQAMGLAAEFPPLRSLGNPVLQNNLPAQLSTFIGRDREVGEVRALLDSARLVTLTGAGGVGKTRLGLQVAADLLDGAGDGVWLVELAGVSGADAVAPAIAQALRLGARPGHPVLDVLLEALASQELLIVLDNCEHLIGDSAKTAEAILRHCSRVRVLATSREPLRIAGEVSYRVPPLSLPDPGDTGAPAPGASEAVTLFADRARAHGVSVALDEQAGPLVVSVCRRLDGMPLAIELAAARLRSLSLSALADRLDQRFRLLTGGSRTALERQQTLRATVDWSYSLLTGAERLLLARLAVFADGFDLDAAEAVCGFGGLDQRDVAGLLGSLVDKSLVAAEESAGTLRYRLLETIRLFAAEQLAEAGRGEDGANQAAIVAAAHCAHYLAVAEAAAPHLTGPDQGSWLSRLDADQANLRRTTEYAASGPDGTALILRLGVALYRYWIARSRQQEAFGLLVPAVSRPEARANPALLTQALVTASITAYSIDVATGRRLAEQAVQIARELGSDRLLVRALAALCSACCFAGEPDTGLPYGQESAERARRLGDDVLLGESLLLCHLAVDPARSPALLAEAIACTERSGDLLFTSLLRNNAGLHAVSTGNLSAARVHLEAAAQAAQEVGWESTELPANLGLMLRAEGELDGARAMFEASLRLSRRNGDRRGTAYACLYLACVAADAGDWNRAAALHGCAQALQDRTGVAWEEFDVRYREDSLTRVRAGIGPDRLELAYRQGLELDPDHAFDLAFSREIELSGRDAPLAVAGGAPGPLSRRERDIVALVAGGATDAQIAERLFLSVNTVRSHLERIRDKTGARRRADLARYAIQAGIEPAPLAAT